MFQCVQKPDLQPTAWLLCLGLLVACHGGGAPTAPLAQTPEPSIAIALEITPTPFVATTAISLPTQTNTSPPTSTLEPTDTPVPTPTLLESEIITLENAHQIAQIGRPFALKNPLAEIVFRDGKTWVVTSENGQQVRVYDFETQKLIATLEAGEFLIERLVVSANGQWLAAISPSTESILLWNLDTFEKMREFVLAGYQSYPTLAYSPTGGEFSNDNHFLVIWGCRIPALNYQGLRVGCLSSGVIVYDLYKGEIYQELNGYQEGTSRATFSPDSSVLVLSGRGESILRADLYVWNIFSKQNIALWTTNYEFGLTGGIYHPNGSLFAAEANGELIFLDSSSWQILETQAPGTNLFPYGLIYGKLEPIILIASEGISGISVRDPEDGNLYQLVKMSIGIISNLALSPDGRFIYTLSEDGFVRKWGIP